MGWVGAVIKFGICARRLERGEVGSFCAGAVKVCGFVAPCCAVLRREEVRGFVLRRRAADGVVWRALA